MSLFASFSVVSGATLLSRVLGLLRDVLFFATFGTSIYGEAFLLAFTIPNLFRRMLGEGTLTSAFIPVFSESQLVNKNNWSLLNEVLSRLFVFLGCLSVFVAFFTLLTHQFAWFSNPKWYLANYLNGVTFFYVIFICASAILVGALNLRDRFLEGALSPVLLNLFLISALCFVGFNPDFSFGQKALFLSLAVVGAGLGQLYLPWFRLRKNFGWKFKWKFSHSSELSEVSSLFWVGAFGAAIAQVNILISRILAYTLDDPGGVSYLYMTARLVELPLGVFAIAISTILFPVLSRAASKGDKVLYQSSLFAGLRMISMLTIPSSIGLLLLGGLVISVLFEWKAFGESNVIMASEVLMIIAWTIPLYALSTFLIKSYHSQKNMKVPLRAALLSLLVNLVCSLTLMSAYGVIGLAWANLLAALAQFIFLYYKNPDLSWPSLLRNNQICLPKIFTAACGMFFSIQLIRVFFDTATNKLESLLQLSVFILVGAFVYFLVLMLLKFPLTGGKHLLSVISKN